MDHYPEVKVSEREYPNSRHDSASSVTNSNPQHSPPTLRQDSKDASSKHTSLPDPAQRQSDPDNMRINTNSEMDINSHSVEAEYRRYTDAPPPYSEKAYEGKSEEEQNNMRMRDYARELSRMMGRQLVKDLKTSQSEDGK